MYKQEDIVDTKNGMMIVQAAITIAPNSNYKSNLLGHRTLYWLQDLYYNDVFYWDTELINILTDIEKDISLIPENEELQ